MIRAETCFGVQDWGRGLWPHRSFWNWGVATGRQDGRLGAFMERRVPAMDAIGTAGDPDRDGAVPRRPGHGVVDLLEEPAGLQLG